MLINKIIRLNNNNNDDIYVGIFINFIITYYAASLIYRNFITASQPGITFDEITDKDQIKFIWRFIKPTCV